MPLRQSSGMLPELQTDWKIAVSHSIPSGPVILPVGYTLLVPSHSSGGSEPSLLHLLKVESSQRMGQEVHLQLHGIAHWMKVLADD